MMEFVKTHYVVRLDYEKLAEKKSSDPKENIRDAVRNATDWGLSPTEIRDVMIETLKEKRQ